MPPKKPIYVHVVAFISIVIAFAAIHGNRFLKNLTQTHWEDELFFNHSVQKVNSVGDCFLAEPVWPGLYRPLTTNCYYYFGRHAFGNQIEIYHAINAVMICITGWLLYLLFRNLLWHGDLLSDETVQRSPIFAALAIIPGVLFVTRRTHTEVVLNTVEFQAIFYVFAGLLMLLLVTTFPTGDQSRKGYTVRLVGGAACLFIALLSKEAAISMGAIWVVFLLLLKRKADGMAFLLPIVVTVVWGGLFLGLFRGMSRYEPTGFTYLPTLENILTNYAVYFFSFFNWISADGNIVMPERAIVLASSQWGRGIVLLLLLFSVIIVLYAVVQAILGITNHQEGRSTAKANAAANSDNSFVTLLAQYSLNVGFSLAFFFLATAPFVLFEDRLFARYGYLGHVGIAMMIGFLVVGVVTVMQRVFVARFRRVVLQNPA